MGKKGKRRKRRRPRPTPAPPVREEARRPDVGQEPRAAVESPPEMGSAPEPREERPRRGLFGGGMGIPSPYPTLGESVVGGITPVGASPIILATAFLLVLALWGFFFAPRGISEVSLLAILGALPPVPLLYDGIIVLQDPRATAIGPFVSVLGLIAVRAVGLAFLSALVVNAVRDGSPHPRAVLPRLRRLTWRMFTVLSAEVGLVLGAFVVVQTFFGPQAGQLGLLLVWIMGLYFLAFAPVILAAEDVPAAEVLRRTVRAARLPGMRHLALTLIYFAFVFYVFTATLELRFAPATPSFLTWLIVLGSTFVHVAALGVLAYRWLAVRDQVPAGPAPRRRR